MGRELSSICFPKTPSGLFFYQFRNNLRDPIQAILKFRTSTHDSVKDTNILIITLAAHSTVDRGSLRM